MVTVSAGLIFSLGVLVGLIIGAVGIIVISFAVTNKK